MSWHILFFNAVVIAGATIGLGGIAVALFYESTRNGRKKDLGRQDKAERRRTEAA